MCKTNNDDYIIVKWVKIQPSVLESIRFSFVTGVILLETWTCLYTISKWQRSNRQKSNHEKKNSTVETFENQGQYGIY